MVVLTEAPERDTPHLSAVESPVPCSAIVGRQLPIWPFAPRALRLLLLVDPSQTGVDQRGLLRAMQHCCVGSETGSQTHAVRAAVNAAHYVLRHFNHEALPLSQVTAAAAVAAVRGNVAYVALVGEAAVFAWRGNRLSGQRSTGRVGRPLGMDSEPRVTLWSTPLRPGDRLVLVCGATWPADAGERMREILAATPGELVESRLSELLGGARVLVDDGSRTPRAALKAAPDAGPDPLPRVTARPSPRGWRRWVAPLVPLAALAIGASAALSPQAQPRHVELRVQAEALLAEARSADDVYQAHALASAALDAARRAADLAPTVQTDLAREAAEAVQQIDRVVPVQPGVLVRLGPTGGNVVDLAVSEDRVFTLDVVEDAIRAFSTLVGEQWPTPETLVARKGASIGSRVLDTPVAIQYVRGPRPGAGALTIVDRARTVAQVLPDGALSARALPSSAGWLRIGALRGDANGNLYVLDSGAGRLLEYAGAGQRLVDPPNPLLDARTDVGRIVEVVPLQDMYVLQDDGSVHRLSRAGDELDFEVRPPDGRLSRVAAIASDQLGGLYLADTAHARVVHVTADGQFVRQLRDPALAGVRQLQTSPDGRRLYGLVAAGILAIDVPDL